MNKLNKKGDIKMKKDIYIMNETGEVIGIINNDTYEYIKYSDEFVHIKNKDNGTILTIFTKYIKFGD